MPSLVSRELQVRSACLLINLASFISSVIKTLKMAVIIQQTMKVTMIQMKLMAKKQIRKKLKRMIAAKKKLMIRIKWL